MWILVLMIYLLEGYQQIILDARGPPPHRTLLLPPPQ